MAATILMKPQIRMTDENEFAACSVELIKSANRCLSKAGKFLYEFSATFGIIGTVLRFQT